MLYDVDAVLYLVLVEFVSSSSDDVEYLLVCDEDYREHLYHSLAVLIR